MRWTSNQNYPDSAIKATDTFSTYEQAIKAAHQLKSLRKEYESRASYLTILTEWMNGLCHSIGATRTRDNRAGDRAKDPKPEERP